MMSKLINYFQKFRICLKNKASIRRDLATYDKRQLDDIGVPKYKIEQILAKSCWK